MSTDNQALKLSYIARCLITDLQPLYAEECIGQRLNEEQALQLILDAFEQASAVITYIPEAEPLIGSDNGKCGLCDLALDDCYSNGGHY